jgi:pimeloyl-ACP methyl ester carboxylesterase
MPNWLSQAISTYTREFEYSGFFGPLSRYRNVDRDWEDLADSRTGRSPFRRCSSAVARWPDHLGAPAIARFPETLPKLYKSEIIEGAGHWIQQEAAPRTNELLIEFLRTLH